MLIGPGGAGAEPPRRRAVPRACSTLSSDASAAKEEPRVTDEPVYAQFGFTDAEWGLISGLPQSVLTAASAAGAGGGRARRGGPPPAAPARRPRPGWTRSRTGGSRRARWWRPSPPRSSPGWV